MRALGSYVSGICILASLMFVGGAWTSPPKDSLIVVTIHSDHVNLDGAEAIAVAEGRPELRADAPAPQCSIPMITTECAPTVVAGGLEFPDPQPDEVQPDTRPRTAAVAVAPPAATVPVTPTPPVAALAPKNVEAWRGLVATHFPAGDVDRALRVIACESAGDPGAANPRSSARGLFQHLGRFWPERSAKAGVGGASILDPSANVAVAAWLVAEGGGWSHWNPSRHCWGGG